MILKMKRMGCLWLAFCCAGALNCSDALADAAKERREIFNQHFTLKEAEILTDKRFKEAVKYEAYSADFLTSAAKDTVQILGEIVVEEATQAGYEMLKEKLLDFGRSIIPTLTSEDILQPNDYPELENHPSFRYEEGILTGVQSLQIALIALKKDLAAD